MKYDQVDLNARMAGTRITYPQKIQRRIEKLKIKNSKRQKLIRLLPFLFAL